MSEIVVDSSVLIAVLRNEQFDHDVIDVVDGAVISAANYAEVWTKIHDLVKVGCAIHLIR